MNVRFHPMAMQELREAEWYIEERRPHWGARFRGRVAEAIRFAAANQGRCVQTYGPAFCTVKVDGFRYRIYYRWAGELLVIYAVYHASRKEHGWEGRAIG